MPFSKPSRLPEWASASAFVVEPSASKKEDGWEPSERPPAEFFNDWMKLVYEWMQWLDQETDATSAVYQARVGAGAEATHATIEAVMADGGVANGARILIMDNRTVNTTAIVVSKSRVTLEFMGAVEYTKGTAATGFNITAEGVKVIGGRFLGWTAGGNKVFLLSVGAEYCVFRDCRFAVSTTQEIDDSAVNAGKTPRIETFTEV